MCQPTTCYMICVTRTSDTCIRCSWCSANFNAHLLNITYHRLPLMAYDIPCFIVFSFSFLLKLFLFIFSIYFRLMYKLCGEENPHCFFLIPACHNSYHIFSTHLFYSFLSTYMANELLNFARKFLCTSGRMFADVVYVSDVYTLLQVWFGA